MKHIDKIDNSFLRTTDIIYQGDSIPTRKIWTDKDPPNSMLLDELARDRIRAIAWNEYAGSNDTTHCHEHRAGGIYYNLPYNHYWDLFVDSHGDTCFDTRTPCENALSTATGIMQIMRGTWERVFIGSNPSYPVGYDTCSWDSLAWIWKICIDNGIYIHDIYYPSKFVNNQKSFPDSCPYSDCGMAPKKKNKEDLKTFGYTAKFSYFQAIQTDEDWDRYITNATTKEAIYVKDVRRYTYQRPWNQE